MEKRKSLENNITLPRKIRVLSGNNFLHAESERFPGNLYMCMVYFVIF